MNRTSTFYLAVIGIAFFGMFAVDSTMAQTKTPGYMIIEYEITDQAAYREYLKA